MKRKYKVKITETLSRVVTVEADSPWEAEQLVNDGWHDSDKSDYILDADDFDDVEFDASVSFTTLSYAEMAKLFTRINEAGLGWIPGFIVFSQESFDTPYSEDSRTYEIASNNKAFIAGAGGWSVFGSCLDGTDRFLRLDEYLRGKKAWKIERCYVFSDDYNRIAYELAEKGVF